MRVLKMIIHDISANIMNAIPYPEDPETEINIISSTEKGEDYNLSSFSMCTHTGTHIDAPYHFDEDGKKIGEEYLEFLQSCQIGLSTQKPEGDYNNTSFPSKILAYLANGLQVITVKIPVIEASKVGNAVHYYNESDPKAVAETIMKVNISSALDTRKLVCQLDQEFRNELYTIIYKEQK